VAWGAADDVRRDGPGQKARLEEESVVLLDLEAGSLDGGFGVAVGVAAAADARPPGLEP
jgi:hypothetical protein